MGGSVEVMLENLEHNPACPHGPTLLFVRSVNNTKIKYFACSACRDRKLCSFFLQEKDQKKHNKELWEEERLKFVKSINHRKLFIGFNKIKQLLVEQRGYCHTCEAFQEKHFWEKHKEHKLVTNISDYSLLHPSEFLTPIENTKKEAQFLFSSNSVNVILQILKNFNYKKVINMGTPRIHENIVSDNNLNINSILLDFDKRYHNFYGPLEFYWYNMFNNHFFLPQSTTLFNDFLQNSNQIALIMDPPFGGRIEPLAHTVKKINKQFQISNQVTTDLAIFWIFPYFMEPQILNSLPNFVMLDYKVDYNNHPLFQDSPKARKYGSPVRIFTNVDPSKIILPTEEGYKFCKKCNRFVANENKHCSICDNCTSKDGRTYVHCAKCERCVKPSWQHCKQCQRCCQPNHRCGKLEFSQECFHCKEAGHKKRDCPKVNHDDLHRKRKMKRDSNFEKSKKCK